MTDPLLIRDVWLTARHDQSVVRKPLDQRVPGSSPGRRTKVVKLYGLMHLNGRAAWAMS